MPLWALVLVVVVGVVIVVVAIMELPPHHRFIDAAGNDDLGKIGAWIDRGADVNKPGLLGLTALAAAVQEGKIDNVRLLLDRGADPNQTSMRSLPLQTAIDHGFTDIAALLLERGADFNAVGAFKSTPLQDAATNARIEILRLFMQRGANLNVKSSHGEPLLFTVLVTLVGARKGAAREPLRETVRFFLEHGANPNVRAKNDLPLICAALDDPETLRILVDGGTITDVTFQGDDVEPAIFAALGEAAK